MSNERSEENYMTREKAKNNFPWGGGTVVAKFLHIA